MRNAVCCKEGDEVGGGEAGVGRAREDGVAVLRGEGDEARGGGDGCVGAAGEELEAGRAGAVRDPDGGGELDEVAGGDVEILEEEADVFDGDVDVRVGG